MHLSLMIYHIVYDLDVKLSITFILYYKKRIREYIYIYVLGTKAEFMISTLIYAFDTYVYHFGRYYPNHINIKIDAYFRSG